MAVQSRRRNAREHFRVHERLTDDYGRFTRGFVDIADKRIAATIEEAIEAALLRPDLWIQLNPNFERGAPGDLGTEGTGSGKSLTYIVPIVDRVLQKGSGRGIRVVVYPASDQTLSSCGVPELAQRLCALALFNSFAFDYFAPQKQAVLTSVKASWSSCQSSWLEGVASLSVADPLNWTVIGALELSTTSESDDRLLGSAPFRVDTLTLEAHSSRVGCSVLSCLPTAANEVDHVMDTFPIVRRTDEAAHGEYRTKRAVEIYDVMIEGHRVRRALSDAPRPTPGARLLRHPRRSDG